MKKIVLAVSFFVLATTISFGQATFKPGFGLGFTDYVNFGGDAAAKVGTQIGGSVAFGKKLYVEPGVFYSVRSTEFTTSTNPDDLNHKVKGIRVPLSVGLDLIGNEESLFNLRVFGGASGFFVTGTENVEKDNVTSPSWGTFVGAGTDIWLLFVDASYEWSLSEASSAWSDSKARTFFVTVGLRF